MSGYVKNNFNFFGSGYAGLGIPLKSNYSEKFGYDADDVPSEWSKKIKVSITNIKFEQ